LTYINGYLLRQEVADSACRGQAAHLAQGVPGGSQDPARKAALASALVAGVLLVVGAVTVSVGGYLVIGVVSIAFLVSLVAAGLWHYASGQGAGQPALDGPVTPAPDSREYGLAAELVREMLAGGEGTDWAWPLTDDVAYALSLQHQARTDSAALGDQWGRVMPEIDAAYEVTEGLARDLIHTLRLTSGADAERDQTREVDRRIATLEGRIESGDLHIYPGPIGH